MSDEKTKEIAERGESVLPFLLMDAADNDVIVAQLKGQVVEHLAYEFEDKATGKPVRGLAKTGVDEACRMMATMVGKMEVIRELEFAPPVFRDKDALFTVKAGRFLFNKETNEFVCLETVFGAKRQAFQKWSKKRGAFMDDPFWYEEGMMKAARNARMRLLSEELKAKIIEEAVKAKKILTVKAEDRDDTKENGETEKAEAPVCPDCRRPAIKKQVSDRPNKEGKVSPNAGKWFYRCEKCKDAKNPQFNLFIMWEEDWLNLLREEEREEAPTTESKAEEKFPLCKTCGAALIKGHCVVCEGKAREAELKGAQTHGKIL